MLQSMGLQGIRHGLAIKRSREEPAHIRGQGQKPGGPHAQRAVAKRSYPTSEVRGSGREYQTATAQEWPRGATLRARSGGPAERRYPTSEVRGGEERSYPVSRSGAAAGRIYPTLLSLRPGAAARRTNRTSKEPSLHRRRRA